MISKLTFFSLSSFSFLFFLQNTAFSEESLTADTYFKLGIKEYRAQKYQDAVKAFEQAAIRERSNAKAAKSLHNIGNSFFKIAQNELTKDPKTALENFTNSIISYREALRKKPNLITTGKNLEIAQQQIENVKRLIKAQNQAQQQKHTQQQDLKKDLEQLKQNQQNLTDKTRDIADNQAKNDRQQENQTNSKQDTTAQAKTQEQLAQQGQQLKDKALDKKTASHIEKALQNMQAAKQHLEKQDPSKASQSQEKAINKLDDSIDSLPAETQPTSALDEHKLNTPNEIQHILQNEKNINDEMRQNNTSVHTSGGISKVEKDW